MKDELGQRYCKEAEGGRRLICIILFSFLGFIFWGVVFGIIYLLGSAGNWTRKNADCADIFLGPKDYELSFSNN